MLDTIKIGRYGIFLMEGVHTCSTSSRSWDIENVVIVTVQNKLKRNWYLQKNIQDILLMVA